ncbi:hypothetical protein M501DRAFT_992096 [Patellaria atrata CBS 101060]|uniref:Uncharacterized protein n=1 Tax=Patellaria atrata CBS 101060 TaxID=1346257 RepID=A0A9P4SC70_9PEZI|nr:hypothetical protein M501DRAFT_992096 [Patellaria atrata CBS 101060]
MGPKKHLHATSRIKMKTRRKTYYEKIEGEFPFLKLPAEIRVMIYEEAIERKERLYQTERLRAYLESYQCSLKTAAKETTHCPSLLLINRQTSTEFMKVFARVTPFTFLVLPAALSFYDSGPDFRKYLPSDSLFPFLRNVTFDLQEVWHRVKMGRIRAWKQYSRDVKFMLASMSTLEVLKLQMDPGFKEEVLELLWHDIAEERRNCPRLMQIEFFYHQRKFQMRKVETGVDTWLLDVFHGHSSEDDHLADYCPLKLISRWSRIVSGADSASLSLHVT